MSIASEDFQQSMELSFVKNAVKKECKALGFKLYKGNGAKPIRIKTHDDEVVRFWGWKHAYNWLMDRKKM